jgi:DNA-binding response OmpR family regulator
MFRLMAQPKTLLIVDDNEDLRTELADLLSSGGEFIVHQASDGASGVSAALESRPDLILLDVDLPDTNGREVCRELRARQVACPVIMLTAADTETEMVGGLDAGANDYVTKPFRLAVLQARIRAQLRSHEHSEGAVFRLGPYEFRPAAKMLVDASGRKVRLTERSRCRGMNCWPRCGATTPG